MALSFNIRSLIQRVILADMRTTIRFYSDQVEETLEGQTPVDPTKDRTKIIPVETKITRVAWHLEKLENHVRNGIISTGNPCPVCRDEYLVLNHKNTELLNQFISEHTGQVLDAFKTGLCQKKQKELLVAIEQAWDQGYLTYDVPFRTYDYSLYNKKYEITE